MLHHRVRVIDHISIPVSDYEASRAFYTRALEPLGYRPSEEPAPGVGALEVDHPEFGPAPIFWLHQQEATPGLHVGMVAPDRDAVDAFHAAALAAGGTDNGPPGLRDYHDSYYAAYVLDPDGVNVEAVCHRPPEQS